MPVGLVRQNLRVPLLRDEQLLRELVEAAPLRRDRLLELGAGLRKLVLLCFSNFFANFSLIFGKL